jgi:hypothetical protein
MGTFRFTWLAFVRHLYTNPQDILDKAQAELRKRIGQTASIEPKRETLTRRLVALDAEREIVLTLCKRGKITIEAAEKSLDETQASIGAIQSELAGLRAQQALAEAAEARLVDAAFILQRAGKNFDNLTPEQQREAIRRIVPEIVVTTVELPEEERKGRRYKDYTLEANVVVGSREVIESSCAPAIVSRSSTPSRGSARSPCEGPSRRGTASS